MNPELNRRTFLTLAAAAVAGARTQVQDRILLPRVSEKACPLELIEPIAKDGHRGVGILRRPPGREQKPAIVFLHPGLGGYPRAVLEAIAREAATPVGLLAAGYVLVVPTYRSRDVDPQTRDSVNNCLAILEYLRQRDDVDPKSIVVFGCSGGGDLALEVAASDPGVACVVAEEPASMLFTGIPNTQMPKRGERYTPQDFVAIQQDPMRYYTQQYQEFTRAKIARITAPILLIQSDPPFDIASASVLSVNNQIVIPELRRAGKMVTVSSYDAQPHCFCFVGGNHAWPGGNPDIPGQPGWVPLPIVPNTPIPPSTYPRIALAAYNEAERFCRRHVRTQPRALGRSLVDRVPD